MHVGLLCREWLGVTRVSLIGRFSADKNKVDLLVTSSWVVELSVDSASMSSSWERRNMAEHKLARASQNRGI